MFNLITKLFTKNKNTMSIEKAVEDILPKGTRIVSFKYHGKVRNVTVGVNIEKAFEKAGTPIQGVRDSGLTPINKAIYKNKKGRKLLRAKVQNDSSAVIKNFFLDEIEDFSYNKK